MRTSPGRDGTTGSGEAAASAEYPRAASLAAIGTAILLSSAALPFAAYLAFLACHLLVELLRSILALPGKLGAHAEEDD